MRENCVFCENYINLSEMKNKKEFLKNLAIALYSLSHSEVYDGRISIGGIYHKNYYEIIENTFCCGKSDVIFLIGCEIKQFLRNTKHNLCNYGIYFLKKNGENYIKIYSGNGYLLSRKQQNFVETKLLTNKIKSDKIILDERVEN